MWRILAESVAGTSHAAKALPCQDAHATSIVLTEAGPALLLAVADGAGSSAFGEVGARLACDTLLAEGCRLLSNGAAVEKLTRELIKNLFVSASSAIAQEAGARKVRPRELACTAIFAIVGESAATFAQLGDGAIVIPDQSGFAPVFWPEPAEYANVTDFLTDADMVDRIVFDVVTNRVDEIAVFSDGLQRLALDYSSRRGHTNFFSPLFAALRVQLPNQELASSLRAFLESSQVNARTDDDKTLVLATRLVPYHSTSC